MQFSENVAHDSAIRQANDILQASLALIQIGGESITTIIQGPTGPTPQNGAALAIRSAYTTYYRAARASAIANGCSPSTFITALKQLGTDGS